MENKFAHTEAHTDEDAPKTLNHIQGTDKAEVEDHLKGSVAYQRDTRKPAKKDAHISDSQRVEYIKEKKEMQKEEQKRREQEQAEEQKEEEKKEKMDQFFGVRKSKKVKEQMREIMEE